MRHRPMAALLSLVALVVGCGSRPPPVWSEAEGLQPGTTMACVSPPSSVEPAGCTAAALPSERGPPTRVLGDVLGLAAVAKSGGDVFVSSDRGDVLRFPSGGGAVTAFAGVRPGTPYEGALLPRGPWLLLAAYGGVAGHALFRVGRARSGAGASVDALPFFEEGETLAALEATPAGTLVAVLGRPGEGHLAFGLVAVPESGSARSVLVPFGSVLGDELGVDATHAYFHGDLGLVRVALRGGAMEPMGTSVTTAIAVGDDEVFFAGMRGVEAVHKGTRELRLIEELHGSSLGWSPAPRLWARGGTAVWQARRLAPDGRSLAAGELRRWSRSAGTERLATLEGDVEDAWIEDDLVVWIAPSELRGRRASTVFATRGPRPQSVAAPDAP